MKILIVIDQFDQDNNGTTISARRFARGLEKRGHEVSIVSTGKQEANKYIVKELKLLPIASHIVKSQGMSFAIPSKEILTEAISQADVVHFYLPFALSVQGLKIAEQLQVAHTTAFHMQPENVTYTLKLGTNTKVNDTIYTYLRNHFYNHFTHIHCPSNFIAKELKEHGYTAKLHVISNGVDEDFHYQRKEKRPEWKDKYVITMVGRLSNEKRQDILIEAIKKSKYEPKIQLVLAGNGPKYNSYRKQTQDLTNTPVIQFMKKEELIEVLSMTDVYVHASDAEIEAISCIEAFACGNVPIIANSKKSATPQFALDDRSLFEAGNCDDLVKKIDYWIENEQERIYMQKQYAESAKQYSIASSMEKMEEMFMEAIAENKRGN